MPENFAWTSIDYNPDNWVWDQLNKSPEVLLSTDQENVYFYTDPVYQSTGTAGVRGTKGFTNGIHVWDVHFLEPPNGTSVMVGVGTERALLHKGDYSYVDLIGMDSQSWGLSYKGKIWHNGQSKKFCQPFFDKTTIITCQLDLYSGTLAFYCNGQSLGVAFTGLDQIGEPLYPIVSSTASESELGLGTRGCRYLSLQEKCFQAIKRRLAYNEAYNDCVDCLPLPKIMKSHLSALY
ncbi:SPRY domain-containing SOCS box protein 3-like isoform X1 [Mytilus trossulus]|uniref:SPRY domain-containing SOCS box protein 3-like isoform X1 n=1 Tax=Mytilus trossulus TaxID=6551 RepID=UPI00300556CE